MTTVAVTGATGFIGNSIVTSLRDNGVDCVRLGRRAAPGEPHRPFVLGPDPDPEIFSGVDALVHCAYDFTTRSPEAIYRTNVVGTNNLLRAAARVGVRRLVLISSMSAYEGTRQLYGRAKLENEQMVRELGGVALRLGLVWGADAGGMAAAVQKLTALPVVPVLGRRSHQFTVHRDDVDAAVRAAVTDPLLTGVIGVAHPSPVGIPQLLRGLSGLGGHDATGPLLAVPWQPVYWAMRAAEAVRFPLPLRADSVLGLVRPAPELPRAEIWAARGMSFRAFPAP